MIAGSKAVKTTAKEVLRNNYLNIVLALLIPLFAYYLCEVVLSLISFLNSNFVVLTLRVLISFFIVFPLILGSIRYIWRMLFSTEDKIVSIFYYYSSRALFIKSFRFALRLFLKIALFALLFYSPAIIIDIISSQRIYSIVGLNMPFWLANLKNISYLFYGIATATMPFIIMRYYVAPFLFVVDEEIDPSEAICMSKVISRGTYSEFIWLIFSFSAWLLPFVFVFPIPFILPYFAVSYTVHCRFAIADYNKQTKEPKKDDMLFYSV